MMTLIELAGYVPAIIFPAATLMQLWHLLKTKTSDGVPALTWLAFAIGNLCLYVYAEKYTELQSIIGQLATAALQIYVVYLIIKYRRSNNKAAISQ
ncbi:hypothetical protein [Rheinheimera sp.]|uniref:hypothetical protein n=1 Tax=Rheinheimera sp. TaxID=1869214 RepID=UPI0027B8A214|nr:hypothetical protein [Rheinheimera sp.]